MDELYKQNVKIVYHFLLSKCHNELLAEDLTQETFLQAYKSIERYNGKCKVSVWLCQIAKHLWYQYLQKNKHEIVQEIPNDQLATTNEVTIKQVLDRLELKDVLKEMQKLPAQIREVMYLRITGDLSFKDVGEIMGRSENWARVNFYRGKEILLKGRMKNE